MFFFLNSRKLDIIYYWVCFFLLFELEQQQKWHQLGLYRDVYSKMHCTNDDLPSNNKISSLIITIIENILLILNMWIIYGIIIYIMMKNNNVVMMNTFNIIDVTHQHLSILIPNVQHNIARARSAKNTMRKGFHGNETTQRRLLKVRKHLTAPTLDVNCYVET